MIYCTETGKQTMQSMENSRSEFKTTAGIKRVPRRHMRRARWNFQDASPDSPRLLLAEIKNGCHCVREESDSTDGRGPKPRT